MTNEQLDLLERLIDTKIQSALLQCIVTIDGVGEETLNQESVTKVIAPIFAKIEGIKEALKKT